MSRIQCLRCDHYYFSAKCKAYPKGIPQDIYHGEVSHDHEFPGDRGIRFVELKISEFVIGEIEPVSKVVRTDHEIQDGVLEHYTLRRTDTGEATSRLVLALPAQLREKLGGRREKGFVPDGS